MRSALLTFMVVLGSGLGGCSSSRNDAPPPATPSPASEPCRNGVGDDVQMAGRTAGAAAKTGLTAAADGIVQAGSSAAGLVHGGSEEAEQRWKEGGKETKADARKNAAETRREANTPPCR
ncbi:MAG: hypothetical protein K0S65_3093 [Labilithrix sp.]|nr:hypothetical protein [Labilithrix sp.]